MKTQENLVPEFNEELNSLTSKIKKDSNFQKWKTFLKGRIEVGSVLSVDEANSILQEQNINDLYDLADKDIFGAGVAGIESEQLFKLEILFFLTNPSLPIQWLTKSSWPEEVDPNYMPPVICCTLETKNEACFFLSSFDSYYLDYLPKKAKSTFFKTGEYEGIRGTWEEMTKLFFELQDEIKSLTEAPELPESLKSLAPKVQSEEEKEKRLNDWKELLGKLPHCYLEKWPEEFLEESPFLTKNVRDDLDGKFWDSTFVVMSYAENLIRHDEAYYGLYFCFLMDGTFKIESDGNYGDYTDAEDVVADVLFYYDGLEGVYKEDSWEAGYKLIIKILEEAYGEGIQETPTKKD